jgi:hypothetical protein
VKTRLLAAGRAGWNFLTVIPGWPDAGKLGRTVYALPLVLPLLGLLVLVFWSQCIRGPQMSAMRAAHRSVVQLEQEIAALRLEYSEEEAAESAAATARLTEGLIRTPEELSAELGVMREAATAKGWVATLHANDSANEASATDAPLRFWTVRGRLAPAADNRACFASLLGLLDRLPPAGKGGSLTRLTVRADEQARLNVEFGVRYAVRPPDAKTP